MPRLSRAVKALRVAAGIKQGVFAERLGVTQSYLSAIEAGKRRPSLDLLERMSVELGIPSGALLSLSVDEKKVNVKYNDLLAKIQDLQESLLGLLLVNSDVQKQNDIHNSEAKMEGMQ